MEPDTAAAAANTVTSVSTVFKLSPGELIALASAIFGLVTTVFGTLLALLLRSYREKARQDMIMLNDADKSEIAKMQVRLDQLVLDRLACQEREVRAREKLEAQVDKLREWRKNTTSAEVVADQRTTALRSEAMLARVEAIQNEIARLPMLLFTQVESLVKGGTRARQDGEGDSGCSA